MSTYRSRDLRMARVPTWIPLAALGGGLVVTALAPSFGAAFISLFPGVLLLGLSRLALLKRFLLAAMVFEIPLQYDRYFGHDPIEAATGALSGFNVSGATFALVLLYVLWIVELAAGTATLDRSTAMRTLPAILYFLVLFLSLASAIDVQRALYEIILIGQALLMLLYVAFNVRDRQSINTVLLALAGGVVLQGLLSVYVTFGPSSLGFGPISVTRDGTRVAGSFGNPNGLGGFLTLSVAPLIGLALGGRRHAHRIIGYVSIFVGVLTLLLTGSRGAWMGFALSFGFLVLLAYRRRWISRPQLISVVSVFILFGAVMFGRILERLGAVDNAAAQSRLPLMKLAWSMITRNIWTGVGSNNFAAALPDYLTVDYSRAWISTVHSKYLLVWAETGSFGLVVFLALLLVGLLTAMRAARIGDGYTAPIAAGLTAGFFGHAVHMTVDIFNGRPNSQMLWLLTGLALSVHRRAASEEQRKPEILQKR